MDILVETLRNLGLTESEIKVYSSLVLVESSTVGPLIDRARVPDSKIYVILGKLMEKGLASYIVKNNVKHFQASPPEQLLRLLDDREEKIREQKVVLQERVLPLLRERKQHSEEKQTATVFEGSEGMKSVFNIILETLKKGEEYQVFMLGDSLREKAVVQFFQNYHKKRILKGIKARLLSETTHRKLIEGKHEYQGMRVQYTLQKIPVGTFLFKNHVMTVLWGDIPTAILVHSKKNYVHYKEFFEDVWSTASKNV